MKQCMTAPLIQGMEDLLFLDTTSQYLELEE